MPVSQSVSSSIRKYIRQSVTIGAAIEDTQLKFLVKILMTYAYIIYTMFSPFVGNALKHVKIFFLGVRAILSFLCYKKLTSTI